MVGIEQCNSVLWRLSDHGCALGIKRWTLNFSHQIVLHNFFPICAIIKFWMPYYQVRQLDIAISIVNVHVLIMIICMMFSSNVLVFA